MNQYIITEEQLCKLINGIDDALECHYFMKEIRSHTLSAELQCRTCKLEGKRSCTYHGYPTSEIPQYCSYKLGINCEDALRNLNGTHIDVWTKDHDAEIAKKEKERCIEVIGGLFLKEVYPLGIPKMVDIENDSYIPSIGIDVLSEIIESLRGEP